MPSEASAVPERRPYTWLPVLILGMTIVAVVIGAVMLHSIEVRLVEAAGGNLKLASAEIADKLDRLLFERYGDAQMMARAFAARSSDKKYLTEYLQWMKTVYGPVYLWLGVTDSQGRIVAATDPSVVGQDRRQSAWFQSVMKTGNVHVEELEAQANGGMVEAVGVTAPILGGKGEFLGAVTTRIGLKTLEDVLIETLREIQGSDASAGPFEYQFLTQAGDNFVDSISSGTSKVNLKQLKLPSAVLSESGKPGYVEEQHLRRHLPVVTGYAQTRGYADYPGLGWTILLRMDRDVILLPIRAMMWKLGVAGVVVWLPMLGLLLWATGRLRTQYLQAQQESEWARAAEAALLQS
ncbi:MAG: cache domain-containing protein, partial [Nitrospiraceae bacterium]